MSWESISYWIEHHPGLASWVQAVGAIASIWGAILISRSQQKAQSKAAAKAVRDRTDSLIAVVESAVGFVTVLGTFVQEKPHMYAFKENWKLVNRQWLESSIFSLSQLPVHELGRGDMVRGYFGIMGGVNDIGRLIEKVVNADAFQEQEFTFMYEEVLKQVRIVESTWWSFQRAASVKSISV
jgi:hypothetical protein